ncbi:MBL fold metallo-hydrolase [Amycolatopsis jejuensis]|uniref:MBL fold metallo-hydrolase n=1 Tax=Amycolatopsis jejuensis TaxID=330084 RepID=UPI000A8D6C52|nr:MBL fold metallo-hydrolase [Amycolatopsis jejuensis]
MISTGSSKADLFLRAATRIPGRRRFLHLVGAAAAATTLAAATPARLAARTRVVLLGTAGGPTVLTPDRAGVSTAVVHDGRIYLVDLGIGAYWRLVRSGLAPGPAAGDLLGNVRGIFFTHLHSDHVADWPALYVTGVSNAIGRTGPPIQVWGPPARPALPRVFPPGRPAPPVVGPAEPGPGITDLTDHLGQAFAADLNDRARDSALAGPESVFHVQDIDLAGIWTPDPEGRPPRLRTPIRVWQDGEVTVTATLVDHHPAAPAFAYRFDTPDGSVVISGDTGVSPNLIDLARNADYLVHEVIDPRFVDELVTRLPPDRAGPMREHLLAAHTTIDQVGAHVAEPAAVRTLVLNHLVPATTPEHRWRDAQRGFSGRLIVGSDLQVLPLGR